MEEIKKPAVVERRAKKKKRSHFPRKQYEVEVIPKTVGVVQPGTEVPLKRVAAYCRVSTDEEAQASSFELQVKHYTEYIGAHENWSFAGIYADEGISGTQMKHREQFLKMVQDCEDGKIDMIITKSISRFARNTVDCLSTIRKLKNLSPPVEIYFEKERLYSLDDKTDMVLGLMASIAQEESRSISANIRWAIRNRMKDGTQKIVTASLLGYDTDEDGNMVIVEKEAEIVRIIYKSFVQGIHPHLIVTRLNSLGLTTVMGNPWNGAAIRNILRNEKYCGDVLMQKTITVDYLTHKTKKNEGEEDQFYIPDHHEPIIDRETWNRAQEILDKTSWKRWKRREQQRLIPLRTGCLLGYVSVSPEWKEISITRLETATRKIMERVPARDIEETNSNTVESEVHIMADSVILEGFEVVDLKQAKGDSVMTVYPSALKFNKATAVELGYPPHVRMLVNVATKRVAIQRCTEKTPNAVPFSQEKQRYAITVKVPALQTAIRKLVPEIEGIGYAFSGEVYPEEGVIIYNLEERMPAKSRGGRRKKNEAAENTEAGEVLTAAEDTTE